MASRTMTPVDAVLLSFSLVCAMTDMAYRKIFNAVTMPVFFSGVLYHVVQYVDQDFFWQGALALGSYAGVGILWFALCALLMALRLISAGDVKFLIALYAWIGPSDLPFALACLVISAGVFSILYMIEDGRLIGFMKGLWLSIYSSKWMLKPSRTYQRPLGIAMFVGTWAYLIWK